MRPQPRLVALALTGALLTLGGGCGSDAGGDSAATDAAGNADSAGGGAGDATTTGDATSDAATSGDTAGTTCTPKGKAPTTLDAKRPAGVFTPKDWDGCKRYPLVILLHGYSATGVIQNGYLGVGERADKLGFVLVVPEGTKAPDGKQFWNATNACCDFYKQDVDDVAYLRGLITQAVDTLAVDPERVYIYGHSNGGFMGHRMACEASDLVTGVASLAGAVTASAASCTPKRAVNVLQIHGTNDKTIPYKGSALFPSVDTTMKRWVGLNGCTGAPTQLAAVDYDNAAAAKGAETTGERWESCKEGTQVELWTMKDTGHIPGFNTAYKDAVLKHILAWTRDK